MNRPTVIVAAAVAVALLTGCSVASYDTRVAYLNKTANRGVVMHRQLLAQGAQPTVQRCSAAAVALGIDEDAPNDVESGGQTVEWEREIANVYVSSCVSGTPRSAPGGKTPPPPPSPKPSTATPSASSSP